MEIVAANGPAARAGMKADDIILAMNDRPVKDGEELVNKVADLPIGSKALFTVDRNGKRLDFKVDVEERAVVWKDSPQFAEGRPELPQQVSKQVAQAKFGITIVRLTDKERQDLGIDDKTGVKVIAVDPGSFAEDIALQENDAILSINRQPVSSPADLMRLQSTLKPGQAVALHIVRSGTVSGRRIPPTRIYVSGRLPDE